jgi:hypothetical protein
MCPIGKAGKTLSIMRRNKFAPVLRWYVEKVRKPDERDRVGQLEDAHKMRTPYKAQRS